MNRQLLLPSALPHRNFLIAKEKVLRLIRACPGGKTVALVGPTQAGKSLIFGQLVDALISEIGPFGGSTQPLVSITLATSQDGRVSPKHVTLRLLKALRHPLYMHIGELDERDHYVPARGRDESTMRVALECAMEAREVLYVALDEAHHLTHTRDPTLRANVLQSIKCLGAIDRTLFLCGGYELAYRGLFDSAHFAGRLLVVEIPPYGDTKEDLSEWRRILKTLSRYLPLRTPDLLVEEAERLLIAANGSFGLLEKILWKAQVHCKATGEAMDIALLRDCLPSHSEHRRVAADIEAGQEALRSLTPNAVVSSTDPAPPPPGRKKARPFRRKPNRYIGSALEGNSHDH